VSATRATGGTSAPLRVGVVTFSPGEHLRRFLDSLETATTHPYEVVLADNGSVDGAPEAAVAAGRATLLRTGGNLGYGAASNRAIAGAASAWVVVANPDVVWTPGSLDELLDASARWPQAAAVGPAIRTPEGDLYPSARARPSLGRGIGHALVGWWWPSNPWTAHYRGERGVPVEEPVGWLSGSCLLLRRDAFVDLGGFDESYFMFMEDLDLGDRLAAAGWLSVYAPSAVIEHRGGHSWRQAPTRMLYHHHRSAYRYLSRRYAGLRFAPLRAVIAGGLVARFVGALVVRRIGHGAAPARSAEVLAPTAGAAGPDARP
jgi:N-acetylglucosaminyl-diphospho-decaprenol L-rhamnosyltransferase